MSEPARPLDLSPHSLPEMPLRKSWQDSGRPNRGAIALRWAVRLLACVVWVSSGIFGLYILAFYVRNAVDGTPGAWNLALPHLYDASRRAGTVGVGLHFITG